MHDQIFATFWRTIWKKLSLSRYLKQISVLNDAWSLLWTKSFLIYVTFGAKKLTIILTEFLKTPFQQFSLCRSIFTLWKFQINLIFLFLFLWKKNKSLCRNSSMSQQLFPPSTLRLTTGVRQISASYYDVKTPRILTCFSLCHLLL